MLHASDLGLLGGRSGTPWSQRTFLVVTLGQTESGCADVIQNPGWGGPACSRSVSFVPGQCRKASPAQNPAGPLLRFPSF